MYFCVGELFQSYVDYMYMDVLSKLLNQVFIETRLSSTLKKCFCRYHHLTLPLIDHNDICMP